MGFPYPRVCSKEGRGSHGSPAATTALPGAASQAVCRPQVLNGCRVSTPATSLILGQRERSDSPPLEPHPHPRPCHSRQFSWPHPSLTSSNSGFGFSSPPLAAWHMESRPPGALLLLPWVSSSEFQPSHNFWSSQLSRKLSSDGVLGNPGALLISPHFTGQGVRNAPLSRPRPVSTRLALSHQPLSATLRPQLHCSAERHK